MKSLLPVCWIVLVGASSLVHSEPPSELHFKRIYSKFGMLAACNSGRYLIDWRQLEDGTVQGEFTVLSASNAALRIITFEDLKIRVPFHIFFQTEERLVVVGSSQRGEIVVCEPFNNSLKQVAIFDVGDANSKVVGFTSRPEEVICELTDRLVLVNWITSETQDLVDRLAAHSHTFCNESDRFLFFPGATKECGRIETLFRQGNTVTSCATTVLPGLGGASGSTTRGTAFARDDAIVERADFEDSTGLTAALAAQVGAGWAIFLWRGDILVDIERMPELDRCHAIRIHDNEIHCISQFSGKGTQYNSWRINASGLVPLKKLAIQNSYRDAELNSQGKIVMVAVDGRSAQLEVANDSTLLPLAK